MLNSQPKQKLSFYIIILLKTIKIKKILIKINLEIKSYNNNEKNKIISNNYHIIREKIN